MFKFDGKIYSLFPYTNFFKSFVFVIISMLDFTRDAIDEIESLLSLRKVSHDRALGDISQAILDVQSRSSDLGEVLRLTSERHSLEVEYWRDVVRLRAELRELRKDLSLWSSLEWMSENYSKN